MCCEVFRCSDCDRVIDQDSVIGPYCYPCLTRRLSMAEIDMDSRR